MLSEATQTALIAAIPTTITSLTGLILVFNSLKKKVDAAKAEIVATKAEIVETKAEVVQTKTEVADLKRNTDGMHTALMDLNARANLAEGKALGAASEQERAAELITDPAKVTEAMNGKDVRDQMIAIEEKIDANTSSIEGVKDAAHAVAKDLAESHERADAHAGGESGAAADAAARLTGKEKQLLKENKAEKEAGE